MPLHSPHARVRLHQRAQLLCEVPFSLACSVATQPAGSLEADAVRFENFTFVAPPGFPASKRSPASRPAGSPASGRTRGAAASPSVPTVGEGDGDDTDMAVDMDMDDDIGEGGGAAGPGAPNTKGDVGMARSGLGATTTALSGQDFGGVRLVPYSHRPPQPPPTQSRGASLGPGVSMPRAPAVPGRVGTSGGVVASPAASVTTAPVQQAASMWPAGHGSAAPAFNQPMVGFGWGAPARGGIMGAGIGGAGAGGGGGAGVGAGFAGPRGIGFVPHGHAGPQAGFMMGGAAFVGGGDMAHSLSPAGGDTAMSVSS